MTNNGKITCLCGKQEQYRNSKYGKIHFHKSRDRKDDCESCKERRIKIEMSIMHSTHRNCEA